MNNWRLNILANIYSPDLSVKGFVPQIRMSFKISFQLEPSRNNTEIYVLRYGVLGDSVNVAARLKSLNTHFGTSCLVSDESLEEARSRLLSITCRHWPEYQEDFNRIFFLQNHHCCASICSAWNLGGRCKLREFSLPKLGPF